MRGKNRTINKVRTGLWTVKFKGDVHETSSRSEAQKLLHKLRNP